MKKVWIVHERLIDWDTADNYANWYIYKTEAAAKKGFDAQLQAFYEEYGLYKPESYSYYYLSDCLARLEIDNRINFELVYQEEPVL